MMNEIETQFSGEQLLQAFCYVAGELSDLEAEAFDHQMLDDQSLCEAVVQATKLSRLVASSEAASVPTVTLTSKTATTTNAAPTSRQSRSLLVTTVSACLCLCLLVAINFRSLSTDANVSQLTANNDAELVVSAWASEAEEGFDSGLDESEELADELDVPEWLLTAVTISDQVELFDEDMEL